MIYYRLCRLGTSPLLNSRRTVVVDRIPERRRVGAELFPEKQADTSCLPMLSPARHAALPFQRHTPAKPPHRL